MYLKQIKVDGFKSFVDHTEFCFEPGITGIVGPNGAGKSNIVDAVRFVLGEQRVKSLRGDDAMIDVIFSGSKTRPPASRAAVTLVFNNEDQFFPLAYSEISIKRVVYRSGENEYYLNGKRCRLKDINSILLDTGLAKESFNIITQGNIQAILNSRPEERRLIFEEAAGVLKYKKRKEEALRKLERTHDNLNRVNDIIKELEQQLEPLRAQKEKAELYQLKKSELNDLEISLLVDKIKTGVNETEVLTEQSHKLKTSLIGLNQELVTKEVQLEQNKLALLKANDALKVAQAELLAVTKEVEKIKGRQQLLLERERYEDGDASLKERLILLKEQQISLEKEMITVELEGSRAVTRLNDLELELKTLTDELTKGTTKINTLTNKLGQLEQQKQALEYEVMVLEKQVSAHQSLPGAVRAVLTRDNLTGVHQTLGTLITVPHEYQIAIQVALGSATNFLVVDDEKVATVCIDYLKQEQRGRATFFPLNIIKARYLEQETCALIQGVDGFIGIASNLVTFKACYRDVILNQLGAVIVTKDLKAAHQLGKLINYRYRIVTLEGDIIHLGGSITGGNSYKDSMLQAKEKLTKQKQALTLLTNEIKAKGNQLKDLKTAQTELQNKEYQQRIERGTCLNEVTMKNELKAMQMEKQSALIKELETLKILGEKTVTIEVDKLAQTYYEYSKQETKLKLKVNELNQTITTLNDELATTSIWLKNQQQKVVKQEHYQQELVIKQNRLEVMLDNWLNDLNETYQLTFEKAAMEYDLVMTPAAAMVQCEKLKELINSLGVVNLGALTTFTQINERYLFLTGERDDLYQAEATLLTVIKELDQTMIKLFDETFKLIQSEFKQVFPKLFGGGQGELNLIPGDDVLTAGVAIKALPPGKKLLHLSLLSGGEKALTAIALLFSILKVRPVPFCLLDEVEAPLDECNVTGFGKYLKTLKTKTQFILITHHQQTMRVADVLYGITMQEAGVSKLASVKLKDLENQ